MNIPETPNSEDRPRSTARRRRARRKLISPLTPDEKTSYLEQAAQKASPSFDFFLFSLLSGAILAVGYLIDSPYFLVLGALLAPLMSPVVGISLATVLGSSKHFFRSFGGFAIGSFLVVLVGALGGFASRIWMPLDLVQANINTQISWPPFLVVGIGSVLTAASLVQDKYNPAVPSVALAYGLYLPLAGAGFGLGSGVEFLLPGGLVLFSIHLVWATILGAVTLGFMGFRPYSLFGFSVGTVAILIAFLLAIGFGSAGLVIGGDVALPTSTSTTPPTLTPSLTPTETPLPPSATQTASITPTTTLTPTETQSPTPTPIQGLINVNPEFGGAFLRDTPNGLIVATLFNGSLVQLLGISEPDDFGQIWIKVLDLENNSEGWILQTLVITATPDGPTAPTDTPVTLSTITVTP